MIRRQEAEVITFRLATKVARERITATIAECLVNTPIASLRGRTPWEARRTDLPSVREWLAADAASSEIKAEVLRLLDHVDGPGRLVAAYDRSGGLLNLFNEPATTSDDDTWTSLREGRSEAEAAELWNRTPNPLFAELTPAEVWVGGGPRERELLVAFLKRYSAFGDSLEAPLIGDLVKRSTTFLHAWTLTPQRGYGNKPPRELIRQERSALVERAG